MKHFSVQTIPYLLILFGGIMVMSGACTKNVFDTVPPEDSTNTTCDTLDYTQHVEPIITAKCVTCHYTGGTNPDFTDPNNVAANDGLIRREVFVDETMPPTGNPELTQAEKDILLAWLDCGGDVTPKSAPTYQSDVAPIVQAKCVVCHTSGGTAPGDFSTYSVVKDKIDNANLRGLVNDGFMPKSGSTPLTESEKQKILNWIDDGAKNN